MSSIVQELRATKRQLAQLVADNNNNNNSDNYNTFSSSQLQSSSAGGLTWNHWHPALTPTSSAAARRTGQPRSKRRRGHAELCYDEYGALDLTSAKKAARTSNTAPRRPSVLLSAAAMNTVTEDSVPLDLRASSRVQ